MRGPLTCCILIRITGWSPKQPLPDPIFRVCTDAFGGRFACQSNVTETQGMKWGKSGGENQLLGSWRESGWSSAELKALGMAG